MRVDRDLAITRDHPAILATARPWSSFRVRPASPIAPAHAQRRRRCPVLPHRHRLGIEGLSPDDINQFLDLADGYVELNRLADNKRSTLRGRTIINCFFESSTRTRTSFELTGQPLGGDVINMSVPTSSMVKGETLIDKPDALIMHPGPMNRGVEIGSEIRRLRPQPDPLAGRDRRHCAHGLSRDPDPRSRQPSDRAVNPLLIRRAASDLPR